MSQTEIIRKRLLKYGRVDNLWSILNAGIWRLGARINELRNEGMKIETDYIVKGGKKTKIAVYKLIK